MIIRVRLKIEGKKRVEQSEVVKLLLERLKDKDYFIAQYREVRRIRWNQFNDEKSKVFVVLGVLVNRTADDMRLLQGYNIGESKAKLRFYL